ncbi:MAG: ABC transporter ATP-binding protein [Rhodospirillales bacterium]|nr:ABC transporter ATP-binding protein [Rhodospirillales bacterium]
MNTVAPLLQLNGVVKTYGDGKAGLGPLDLALDEGEFLAVVGPSGCGKSTLLRITAGLLAPARGAIVRRFGDPPRRGDIGFVFQDATLLPWTSVFDNVFLPLHLAGVRRADAQRRIDAVLALVGLDGVAGDFPHELSGGMRMRVSIARALATRPRLLLLDEPFAALDEPTRFKLNDDLLQIWREEKLTVLFVTHSIFEAVFLATRVLVMSAGPGRVRADLPLDLPQPRTQALRMEPAFSAACRQVSEVLAGGKAA